MVSRILGAQPGDVLPDQTLLNPHFAMMLSIRYLHFSSTPALDALLENGFLALGNATRIDEAMVTVTHRPEESPAYRAAMVVAVPGPDFRIDVVDHTPEQVVRRALATLETRMRQRHMRRARQRITDRKHDANFRVGRRSR